MAVLCGEEQGLGMGPSTWAPVGLAEELVQNRLIQYIVMFASHFIKRSAIMKSFRGLFRMLPLFRRSSSMKSFSGLRKFLKVW